MQEPLAHPVPTSHFTCPPVRLLNQQTSIPCSQQNIRLHLQTHSYTAYLAFLVCGPRSQAPTLPHSPPCGAPCCPALRCCFR